MVKIPFNAYNKLMSILDIIFPRRCVSCGKLGRYFCEKCRSDIKLFDTPICPICEKRAIDGATHPVCRTKYTIDGLTSFFRYTGPIRQAVKLIKYRYVSDLAEEFINLIPSSQFQFSIFNFQFSILIPIPLHPFRLRFRGFNQAEILGKVIAERLKIPINTDILKRVRKTTPQVEMKDRKKRLTNMENVFAVCPNPPAGGSQYSNILLFDDVFTTGATLRSAANVLKRAGAKKVWGVVLAHG